jgi:acyl carrier protein
VANEAQLNSFMQAFHRSGWPPIRGVVHAAGLVQDRTLLQLDTAALNQVLQPKVLGGWLLHRLLENAPIDFFVLFSSVSSLLAQPGQGNYAAANAFLDALAHYRRIQGQPALSINWGIWAELGFATTPGGKRLAQHLARLGIGSLEPKQGLEVLGRLLRQDSVQVAVMPVNWSKLRDFYPASRKLPLLSYLLQEEVDFLAEAGNQKGKGRVTRDVLLAAEPSECQQLLESYLGEQVARVLGLATSQLDLQQPLNNLGLDSLMAVELKNLIESDLGVAVSVTNFLQGSSVAQLATQMLEQLTTAASILEVELALPATQSQSEQKDNQLNVFTQEDTEQLLAYLRQISDEEVDSLLSSILAKNEIQESELSSILAEKEVQEFE